MEDEGKTREQLIEELRELRRRVARLEAAEAGDEKANDALPEGEERFRLLAELRSAKAWAEAANRSKAIFVSTMSHELRTPLNAVIGMSDILLNKHYGDLNPRQERYLTNIQESGYHLLSLIDDILDLSKTESGHSPLRLSELDLKPLLEQGLAIVRERAQKRSISLSCEAPEGLPAVLADERKVKQAVLSLLSNAVKFTPDGGKVGATAGLEDGGIRVCVWDTGIGIAPEDREKVFLAFEQVDTSLSKQYEGAGLGLALVKQLVEQHGGRVWLEIEVGKGSRFYLFLPFEPAEQRGEDA